MYSLQDRVAVITGAGSGIGQELAVQLAGAGCNTALADIRPEGLETTSSRCSASGRQITKHVVDVAEREQVEQLAGVVLASHGRADILVNNAGVALAGPFERYSMSDLEWIIHTNLWGALHACNAFLPTLRRQASGVIVNIASDFGLIGMPGKTAYCATKFALRGFSEALRAELWDSGITVICVYPGAVNTNLIRDSRAFDERKRQIESEFVARRSIPVETVARQIVRGIQRQQARVLIGTDTLIIDLAARWFPGLTAALIGRFHRRMPFI